MSLFSVAKGGCSFLSTANCINRECHLSPLPVTGHHGRLTPQSMGQIVAALIHSRAESLPGLWETLRDTTSPTLLDTVLVAWLRSRDERNQWFLSEPDHPPSLAKNTQQRGKQPVPHGGEKNLNPFQSAPMNVPSVVHPTLWGREKADTVWCAPFKMGNT